MKAVTNTALFVIWKHLVVAENAVEVGEDVADDVIVDFVVDRQMASNKLAKASELVLAQSLGHAVGHIVVGRDPASGIQLPLGQNVANKASADVDVLGEVATGDRSASDVVA